MNTVINEEKAHIPGAVSIGATISYKDKSKVSPAIVLIMGTGKTDRDGNEKHFRTDLYKNLAELVASVGFVCVRYDKRGTYQTEGEYGTAGLSDLTNDAISVIRYVKSLVYVDESKVIVCGHSEGAQIATLLTKQESIAGLVLLGGAGMCMKDALLYQNRLAAEEFECKKGLLGILLRSQTAPEKTTAKVNAMFQKCAMTDKSKVFFGGIMMNAKWIREHGSHTSDDYYALLKQFEKPVLAITGTADLSADFSHLGILADSAHIQIYAPQEVNHILREIDDGNSMLTAKKQYARLAKQPIHKTTEQTIKEWLSRYTAKADMEAAQ